MNNSRILKKEKRIRLQLNDLMARYVDIYKKNSNSRLSINEQNHKRAVESRSRFKSPLVRVKCRFYILYSKM